MPARRRASVAEQTASQRVRKAQGTPPRGPALKLVDAIDRALALTDFGSLNGGASLSMAYEDLETVCTGAHQGGDNILSWRQFR
jgi:hypothetical protein